jgi:hypothetical protein
MIKNRNLLSFFFFLILEFYSQSINSFALPWNWKLVIKWIILFK